MPTTYTLRHVPGYSALDHLAKEIIVRADIPPRATKRQVAAALKASIAAMRATMGLRSWPRIDIVRAE